MSMHHITPVPNQFRSALHDLPEPAAWTSKQARRLVGAILTGTSIVDLAAAPNVVRTRIEVVQARYGQTISEQTISRALDAAEAEVARLRRYLQCYGVEAIMPCSEPEPAPRKEPGDDRQTYMLRWMDFLHAQDRRIVRAGSSAITRNESGAYVLAEAEVITVDQAED